MHSVGRNNVGMVSCKGYFQIYILALDVYTQLLVHTKVLLPVLSAGTVEAESKQESSWFVNSL
jgi:hypothetical protein